ncbi:MAG: peroxiredoxin [Planctomycetota bacterium]
MLKPGDTAPDFTLPDANGDRISLAALLEDGPVVLYFYPADFTPGCTAQACMVRDLHGELVAAGLRVAGISPQKPASHARFAEKFGLPFTLLCDTDKSVAKRYGAVWPLGIAFRRVTYLVDQNRQIIDAVTADLNIGRHKVFVKRAIERRAQADAAS